MTVEVRIHDPNINCILLNNLDGVDRRVFLDDWRRSRVRVCADGGLGLLKILSVEFHVELQSLYPNYVVGDLDSVNAPELDKFKKSGGNIIHDTSQNSTDFEKCIVAYREKVKIEADEWLLVYGAMGGERLDHTLAAFHPLFTHSDLAIKIIQGHAAAFILPHKQTDSVLHIHEELGRSKCGLFPLLGPTRVSTEGLQWNLDGAVLEYGKLISVCNLPAKSLVKIDSDHSLLFTIQLSQEGL